MTPNYQTQTLSLKTLHLKVDHDTEYYKENQFIGFENSDYP